MDHQKMCEKQMRSVDKEVYMDAIKKFRNLASAFIVLVLVLAVNVNASYAQIAGEEATLSGWFSIVWGDSQDGKSVMVYTLTDVTGQRTSLQVDKKVAKSLGGVLQFNGKYVSVQGTPAAPSHSRFNATARSSTSTPSVLNVISISIAPPPGSRAPMISGGPALAAVTGSHPWVTIMCQFSDVAAQPQTLAYFQGMYGNTQPGLDHYWRELSFNTANVNGSAVGTGWYTINTLATYNPGLCQGCADLNALANACIAAADADIDFSQYDGINMMFNANFDFGFAWGGGWDDTLDGVTKHWSITWEPPWGYADISVIAHEMGHGFGLPHSTAIMRDPDDGRAAVYDNSWDVMSQDRYNCGAGSAARDAVYGCMAQHTISYHKDFLGWIPGARKTTVASGAFATLTLEDLAAPASGNFQMATIPIGGSATHFYAVEARRFTGYDAKLPDEAIIIHDVDTTEDIPALLAPAGLSATDAGVIFTVGETFADATNNIRVIVNSATASGFEVTIANDANLPPTSKAGGPYTTECAGATTAVALNGAGSSDPEGAALTYSWSTDCSGTFNDSTIPSPVLTVNSGICLVNCNVSLTVTDSGGLSDTDSATITIRDTAPPSIVCPAAKTVQCNTPTDPGVTGSAVATDVCIQTPVVSHSDTTSPGSCPQASTIQRTWRAADGCSNSSSCLQTIQVVDTTPPALIGVPGNQTVQCDAVPPPASVTATDNCDPSVVPAFSETRTDGSCAANYTLTRIWTAADDCGNGNSGTQVVTVQDTVGPVISCNSPATMTPPDAPISFAATAVDNCSMPTVQITDYNCVGKRSRLSSCIVALSGDTIRILNSGGVGDTISWTVRSVDGCGNATIKSCSINVVNPGQNK